MREIEFREWLVKNKTSDKVISDTISRVKRAERELCIDLDDEFKKNCYDELLLLFKNYGKNEAMKKHNTSLPVGQKQLAAIKCAIKKYMGFLTEEHS